MNVNDVKTGDTITVIPDDNSSRGTGEVVEVGRNQHETYRIDVNLTENIVHHGTGAILQNISIRLIQPEGRKQWHIYDANENVPRAPLYDILEA